MSLKQSFDIQNQLAAGALQLNDGSARYSDEGASIEYRYEIVSRSKNGVRLRIFFEKDGIERSETVSISRDRDHFQLRRAALTLHGRKLSARSVAEEERHDLYSPMPGFIRKIFVAEGDEVKKGDRLAVLEAMKMEHTLTAARDGIVAEVLAGPGEQVEAGAPLIRLEEEPP